MDTCGCASLPTSLMVFLAQIFRRGNLKVEGVTLEDWLHVAQRLPPLLCTHTSRGRAWLSGHMSALEGIGVKAVTWSRTLSPGVAPSARPTSQATPLQAGKGGPGEHACVLRTGTAHQDALLSFWEFDKYIKASSPEKHGGGQRPSLARKGWEIECREAEQGPTAPVPVAPTFYVHSHH